MKQFGLPAYGIEIFLRPRENKVLLINDIECFCQGVYMKHCSTNQTYEDITYTLLRIYTL